VTAANSQYNEASAAQCCQVRVFYEFMPVMNGA
jgi:hypothetical protein